jgi:hypothetical protein
MKKVENKEKRVEDHPFISGTPLSRCNDCVTLETNEKPRSIFERRFLKKEFEKKE